MGVCRSDTWKFSTSISDAPNVASTFTFSYIWNWTFLLVMESKHRRKPSLSTDRASCSFCSCSLSVSEAAEEEMEVRQRAMKRGELGSNPRLLGSGPLGRRSTGTGVAMLTASAKACKRKISQEQENKCAQEKLFQAQPHKKRLNCKLKINRSTCSSRLATILWKSHSLSLVKCQLTFLIICKTQQTKYIRWSEGDHHGKVIY